MTKVYVKTLGCKVNTFDSNALANQLCERGFELTEQSTEADITIINSCSVTANAEKEARYLARRHKRLKPDTFVVMTGCYAQTDSAKLSQLAEVDFVVPNEVKEKCADLIRDSYASRGTGGGSKVADGVKPVSANRQSHFKSSLTLFDRSESAKTRVFMKIQDGCNGFCSYCLIPYARGASRSVPAEAVLAEFDRQIHRGVKEIVFTGIHIGDFGRDNDKHASDHPIVDLMQAIFERKGDWRLRISSLEPSELTRPLIEVLHANRERFSPHFHLPLQSGCDRILKLMRRSYDTQTYREAVVMTRDYFPEANIGADVIPGFPGESAADFDETCEFVTSLDLSYLHVFPYSKRPNTAAERMPHHIDPQTIKARAKILRDLSLKLSQQYARKFIGHSAHVVWEDEFDQQQRRRGYTENYLSVAASKQLIVDTSIIQKVRIAGYSDHQNLLALDAH